MSLALTHFAFGAAATMLAVTFLLPGVPYPRVVSALGGVWAMIPDAHHVSPVFAAQIEQLHRSAFANLFWAHRLFDAVDPGDSNEAALLAVAFLLAATVVAETAEYYFGTPVQRRFGRRTRAQTAVSSLGGAFAGRGEGDRPGGPSVVGPSLARAVRLVGGALAVVGGVGLLLLVLRTSSHPGLLAGLGALLELQGAATLLGDERLATRVAGGVPARIRLGAKAAAVLAACLVAFPLLVSASTPTTLTVANATVGALLVLTAIRL